MNSQDTSRKVRELNRNLNIAGILSVGVVLGLIYCFGLRLVMAESTRLSGLVEETKEFLGTTDQITASTREIKVRSEVLETEMERILAGVPTEPRESEFLGQISGLVQGTSLKFDEFRPAGTTAAGQYRQLEVMMSGVGTYRDICRFLAGLEELPRLCRVSRLDIEAPDEPYGAENRYPVSMTLVIFYSPPDALKDDPDQTSEAN